MYLQDKELNTVLENYFDYLEFKELIEICQENNVLFENEIITEATKFPLKPSFKTNKYTKELYSACKDAEKYIKIIDNDNNMNKSKAIKGAYIATKVLRVLSRPLSIIVSYAINPGFALGPISNAGILGLNLLFGPDGDDDLFFVSRKEVLGPFGFTSVIVFAQHLLFSSIEYLFRIGEDVEAKKYAKLCKQELEKLKSTKNLSKKDKEIIDNKIKYIDEKIANLNNQKIIGKSKSVPEKIIDKKEKITKKQQELKELQRMKSLSTEKQKYDKKINKVKEELDKLQKELKDLEEKLK